MTEQEEGRIVIIKYKGGVEVSEYWTDADHPMTLSLWCNRDNEIYDAMRKAVLVELR